MIPYFNVFPCVHRVHGYRYAVTGLAVRERLGVSQNAWLDEAAEIDADRVFYERKADEIRNQRGPDDGIVYIRNGNIRADEEIQLRH